MNKKEKMNIDNARLGSIVEYKGAEDEVEDSKMVSPYYGLAHKLKGFGWVHHSRLILVKI